MGDLIHSWRQDCSDLSSMRVDVAIRNIVLMLSPMAALVSVVVAIIQAPPLHAGTTSSEPSATFAPRELRSPSVFVAIRDERQRSIALFAEAGKVIQSPRCLNCHPPEREPTQGDDLHPHVPPAKAGADGHGVAGLPCVSCHGADNFPIAEPSSIRSIPGDPKWGLAPASMAWQGKSLSDICQQIKDPARNGGRSLSQIHEHMASDHLVGWSWRPGAGRVPAPGTQAEFGTLVQAWIDSGAHCPAL